METRTRTRDRNALALVQDWYDKPDAALLSPDFGCKAIGYPTARGSYHGAKGMLDEFFAEIGRKYAKWSVEVERMIDAGDEVVVIGSYDARPNGGDDATYPFVHVWTAGGGAIRSVICCTDVR